MIILIILLLCNLSCNALNHDNNKIKRAIVVGASVGMGKAIAQSLAADGYIVGMTARRVELLEEIQQQIPTQTYIARMDVSDAHESVEKLNNLITQMGGLDLLVIAATGFLGLRF